MTGRHYLLLEEASVFKNLRWEDKGIKIDGTSISTTLDFQMILCRYKKDRVNASGVKQRIKKCWTKNEHCKDKNNDFNKYTDLSSKMEKNTITWVIHH